MQTRATAILMLVCFGQAACVRNLPPPPAPAQELPKPVANVPPDVEGKGRVVIDVTNGPAEVDEVLATAQSEATDGRHTYVSYGEVTRPICLTTPCAVNFEFGQHNLRLVSKSDDHVGSVGTVDVGQNDSVFRHTMGTQSTGGVAHSLGVTSTILGLTGAILGGSLLFVGAVSSSSQANADGTTSSSGSGLTGAGAVTLGIGAGLLALGIGLMVASPPTIQEGSSTQFSLDKSNSDDAKKHPVDALHSL
ncbi:MAG: hypothetical protein ABI421_03860 [Polyangiaceae bacterium]